MVPRATILIVDGYDRRGRWGGFAADEARSYPWIELCLEQVAKHTDPADHVTLIWDNAWLPRRRRMLEERAGVRVLPAGGAHLDRSHGAALDILVRRTDPAIPYVITLDSDAFPIADGWIETLLAALEAGDAMAGVYRDEMAAHISPYLHPSCMAARRADLLSYGVNFQAHGAGSDVGKEVFDVLTRGRPFHALRRSNVRNAHPIMGGVYGDLVYHHGAGSRRPRFRGSGGSADDEQVRQVLRDAAFSNLPCLLAQLRGEHPWTIPVPYTANGDAPGGSAQR